MSQYIKECDTGKLVCHLTISAVSDGRPCIISLGMICSAWKPLMDHYMTECPGCGIKITPAQMKEEGWGKCMAS